MQNNVCVCVCVLVWMLVLPGLKEVLVLRQSRAPNHFQIHLSELLRRAPGQAMLYTLQTFAVKCVEGTYAETHSTGSSCFAPAGLPVW